MFQAPFITIMLFFQYHSESGSYLCVNTTHKPGHPFVSSPFRMYLYLLHFQFASRRWSHHYSLFGEVGQTVRRRRVQYKCYLSRSTCLQLLSNGTKKRLCGSFQKHLPSWIFLAARTGALLRWSEDDVRAGAIAYEWWQGSVISIADPLSAIVSKPESVV